VIRNTGRRATRSYMCRCGRTIEKGDCYVESVISPGHGDIANGGWWRDRECENCAIVGMRDHLIINREFGLMNTATETRSW
jgi:hypothetical protein